MECACYYKIAAYPRKLRGDRYFCGAKSDTWTLIEPQATAARLGETRLGQTIISAQTADRLFRLGCRIELAIA